MITAGSIKVYSHLSISSLLDMEMETKEGCHSRLALRGLSCRKMPSWSREQTKKAERKSSFTARYKRRIYSMRTA